MRDQAARDAIVNDLQSNLLVEASAGSGKTRGLVDRLVNGLKSGHFRPETTVAMTFTRKAASELRGRVRLELEKQRLNRCLDGLERLFIGTVHSFCGQLLRTHPIEAGVSPNFRESDEGEDARLLRRTLRRFLDSPEGRLLTRELSEADVGVFHLERALTQMCQNPDVDYPAPVVVRPELGAVWEETDQFVERLEATVQRPFDRDSTCALQAAIDSLLHRLPTANRSRIHGLLSLLRPWLRTLLPIQKYWGQSAAERKAAVAAVQEVVESFRTDTVEPFLEAWQAYLYSRCNPCLVTVRAQFQAERERQGLLNFNDLLVRAARLLRENTAVRDSLQNQVRHLLVDEFQDTDPLQAEIAFLLAASDSECPVWTETTPRRGALFIVGDPKQSIYRFRRADVRTYATVRDVLLRNGGKVVSLSTSFRSGPALCEWTNAVFRQLLPEESNTVQAGFAPLEPYHSERGHLTGVFRLTQTCQRYGECAEQEAGQIARFIRARVEAGQNRWSDFLLLTWRRRELAVYGRALDAAGIPHDLSTESDTPAPTVQLFLQLLGVLTDPQDTIGLVGLLRSELCGLSDAQLYRFVAAGGSFSLFAERQPENDDVTEVLQRLRGWRELLDRELLGVAAERLLEQPGLLPLALCAQSGLGEASELLAVLDQLRNAQLEGSSTAEAVRHLAAGGLQAPLSVQAGRRDAVRVMNLHQAKGLEAPIVFLAAPTGGTSLRAEHCVQRSDNGSLGYLSLTKPYGRWSRQVFAQPLDWEDLQAEELAFLAAERTRLLYVAATRAAQALIVGRWAGTHGSAKRPWEALDPYLEEAPELEIPELDDHPVPSDSLSGADYAAARETLATWQKQVTRPSFTRSTVTGSNLLVVGESIRFPVPAELLEGRGSGPAWGTLIHRLLDKLALHPDLTREELGAYAQWFVFETPELKPWVPEAVDTVEELKCTPFWGKVLAARERLPEVPIACRRERDGRLELVFGVVDLAMRGDKGWELVDYKTDRATMEELLDRYGDQIASYAESWGEVTGEAVVYAGLYGVREGRMATQAVRWSETE